MAGEGVLTIRTGPGGSGKTYWAVKWIMEEVLPYYTDSRIITNLPLLSKDRRIVITDFGSDWSASMRADEGEGSMVVDSSGLVLDKSIIIVDEAHTIFSKANDHCLRKVIGLSRHHDIRWVFLSQSKDKLPGWVDEEAEIWFESANGRTLRDATFGIRLLDLQNVYAKIFGKFHEFFKLTEYVRANRRWKAIQTYSEWFNKTVGDWYNTKNTGGASDTGEPVVVHDYMRFSLPVLLGLVCKRNWHVMPTFLLKNGLPILFVTVGLGWMGWSYFTRSSLHQKVAPVNPTPVVTLPSLSSVVPRAPEQSKPSTGLIQYRRVLTWSLICAALVGCRGPTSSLRVNHDDLNVARQAKTDQPSPRLALFGAGHSLDSTLKAAGIEVLTGETVDGPLVGREVVEAARRLGFQLDASGKRMMPVERQAVPVPDELRGYVTTDVAQVGGYSVALATPGQIDQWRQLADVVHESYAIDLLICSVNDDQSRSLGLVTSASGSIDVSYPGKPLKWGGGAKVKLSADGSVVDAREVARPVLHASHDTQTDLHVGSRVPVRTTQTTTDGTTRAVGATLTFVSTGVEVSVKPSRVSTTQIRLTGNVSVSDQTSVTDGAPVTSERRVTVDQLLTLGEWGAVARLDRVVDQSSGAWFGLGGTRHASSETFVVLARPRQVSRPREVSWPIQPASARPMEVRSEMIIPAEVKTEGKAQSKPEVSKVLQLETMPQTPARPKVQPSPKGETSGLKPSVRSISPSQLPPRFVSPVMVQ